MNWIHNQIVFLGSWLAFLVSVIWGLVEGGYEPWIVALLGVVGIAANRQLLPRFGKQKRELTPEQKIEARDKFRPLFTEYFNKVARHDYHGDAIVHDMLRVDEYPELKKGGGISAWFRVGFMGTYNHGILLGLRWTYIVGEGENWIEADKGDYARKVMLIGRVPYESIFSVNFDGDAYYNKPHVFCYFDYKGEPYEELFYGEEFRLGPGLPFHYAEIAKYKTKRWRIWPFR